METQFQTVSLSERYQRGDMWKQGMGAEEEEGEGRTGCVEDVAVALWLRQHVGFLAGVARGTRAWPCRACGHSSGI